MQTQHRYTLDKRHSKQYTLECPSCSKLTLTPYVDTGNFLAIINKSCGRCSREINCGYHYPPRKYFADNPTSRKQHLQITYHPTPVAPPKPTDYIDPVHVQSSVEKTKLRTNFTLWLYSKIKRYGQELILRVISDYRLGGYAGGKVVFWQIDYFGKVRTGKVMQYNQTTGKRVKDPEYPGRIDWIHNLLKYAGLIRKDFNLKQCLYGEHLLPTRPDDIVAVFESEKTAIVASCLYPQMVCLATGGLNGLTAEKCKVLKGRRVIFFPDLKCYDLWKAKVDGLAAQLGVIDYKVDNTLEKLASEEDKEQGLDLCDYIICELEEQMPKQ